MGSAQDPGMMAPPYAPPAPGPPAGQTPVFDQGQGQVVNVPTQPAEAPLPVVDLQAELEAKKRAGALPQQPPAQPEAPMPGGLSPEALMAEGKRLEREGKAAAREEKANAAALIGEGKASAVEAEAAAREQSALRDPLLQHQASAMQAAAIAQGNIRDKWNKQVEELAILSAQYTQQVEGHLAASHPSDIWGTAGVNPVFGAMGIIISGLGAGLSGSPNAAVEMLKYRAGLRTQQLDAERQALTLKGSMLGQLYDQAHQILGDGEAANEKFKALLTDKLAADLDVVANLYAPEKTRQEMQAHVQKLKQDAFEMNAKADKLSVDALHQRFVGDINIAAEYQRAHAQKGVADKAQARDELNRAKAAQTALKFYEDYQQLSPLDLPGRVGKMKEIAKFGLFSQGFKSMGIRQNINSELQAMGYKEGPYGLVGATISDAALQSYLKRLRDIVSLYEQQHGALPDIPAGAPSGEGETAPEGE